MLICNNCFHENADGTIRCTQCNMEGNFSYKLPYGSASGILKKEQSSIQCNNCGSHSPGEGQVCIHCHFPLASHGTPNKETSETGTYHNLKTGT